MQQKNKADLSSIQVNNDQLLPQKEVASLILEVTQNVPPKKQQTIPWGAVKIFLSIFLIGYGINWIRFDLFPGLASCGMMPEELAGKYTVSTINRAQEAYFLENQIFAQDIQKLKLDLSSKKTNYKYSLRTTEQAVFNYGIASPDAYKLSTKYFGPFWWDFKEPLQLKSYVGAVFAVPNNNLDSKTKQKKMATVDVVCSSLHSSSTTPIAPKLVKGVPTCGAGTKEGVR